MGKYLVLRALRYYGDTGIWEPLDLRSNGSRELTILLLQKKPFGSLKIAQKSSSSQMPSDLGSNSSEVRITGALERQDHLILSL